MLIATVAARVPLSVVVHPWRRHRRGVHHRRDHPTVKVGAVIRGRCETESDHDVVGFVAFEHDAEPADERRLGISSRTAWRTFVLLLGGQRVGHGR